MTHMVSKTGLKPSHPKTPLRCEQSLGDVANYVAIGQCSYHTLGGQNPPPGGMVEALVG